MNFGFQLSYVLITLVLLVLVVIANWKLFTKAGEAGWKSIIPIYGTYTGYKICWKTSMFWIMIIATCVGAWLSEMSSPLPLLGWVIGVIASLINLVRMYKLSKSFGHGIGFTIGLVLLYPLFALILAFGGSSYQGAQN